MASLGYYLCYNADSAVYIPSGINELTLDKNLQQLDAYSHFSLFALGGI